MCKKNSTHYYKIDFLISQGSKIIPLEIKSSGLGKHESIIEFSKKYSKQIKDSYVFSQKDYHREQELQFMPLYYVPLIK